MHVESEFQNCFLCLERTSNPPDFSWLEVISETKESTVNDHGWIAHLHYHVRE